MASQVPTGYNPETSLLQGGTATITPVQGGGGMEAGSAPPGYNPDQSLLNTGHNVPITPIRGGAAPGEKLYQDYYLEQYEPPLSMVAIPTLPDNVTRRNLINEYANLSKPDLVEVTSLERVPVAFTLRDDVAPTYQKCSTSKGKRRLPLNFFEIVRKRIVFIDEEHPNIWIIPNLKGDISKFLQYMNIIPKDAAGNIDPKHYVFFTGSFFSLTSIKDNLILYHQFLTIKTKNMKHLYYLNHLNDDFINVSCSIISSLYSTETLKTPEAQEKPLTTFYEPDIVFFTKPHIILKNSEPPVQRDDNRVKASKLMTMPGFPNKSFLLVPSRDAIDDFPSDDSDEPEDTRWFSLAFNRSIIKEIRRPGKSEILCPTGKTCNGFQAGYKLVELGDDRKIEKPGVYLLTENKDRMPFLKEKEAKLTPEQLALLQGVPTPPVEEKEVDVVELEPEEIIEEEVPVPVKKKSRVLPGIDVKKPPPEEPFKASADAKKAMNNRTIEINTVEYKIRIPFEKGIKEDWLAGKFTAEEVELLNALQFTPTLLSETFGSGQWKPRLAEFLEQIVMSNCFHDTTLLTHRECSNAQQFVRKVYLQLYSRTLTEIYSEMGVPKPESFDTLLAQMKKLRMAGPIKGSYYIDKYDYTGDLLERFQVIHFDKEKGEYFTDFSQMSDATREILNKMKLYRVEDMNIDEITKAILERLKIPIPPAKPGAPPPPPGDPKPPPPSGRKPPPRSSLLPTQEQCDIVRKYSTKSIDRLLLEKSIETFLNTDAEAKAQKVTMDIFKECIAAINAQLGLEYFKIANTYTGSTTPEVEYEIKNVSGDGWCFYHALLQSVGPSPNYNMLTNDEIKADTDDEAEVTAFIGTLQAAILASPEKVTWENLYNIIYGKGKYTAYIQSMNDVATKPWADPDFGIGKVAANELRATIEIYRKIGNDYNVIVTYTPSTGADPARLIRLHYINNNHYQILLKKPRGAPPPYNPPPPPPPPTGGKRFDKYNLPGPDPTDQDCMDLHTYLTDRKIKPYLTGGLNQGNAYELRESSRDRAKHPDYSIYFLAKCWDKRPDLFPANEYYFQNNWVNLLFAMPRTGNPTPAEINRIETILRNRVKPQDPQNITKFELLGVSSGQGEYDFSFPFIKKALENSTNYRIEPTFAATIPDFDPVTSQGGGGGEILDLGEPIQEGGEVLDLGDPVEKKYRNQTKRNKKNSNRPSRRHGRHEKRNHK